MKNTTTTTTNGHDITVSRIWSFHSVRSACIRNDLYTRGTCSEYDKMLDMVENTEPTVAALYEVAKDINDHSKGQTVTNIMYILENEAIYKCFMIDGNEEA